MPLQARKKSQLRTFTEFHLTAKSSRCKKLNLRSKKRLPSPRRRRTSLMLSPHSARTSKKRISTGAWKLNRSSSIWTSQRMFWTKLRLLQFNFTRSNFSSLRLLKTTSLPNSSKSLRFLKRTSTLTLTTWTSIIPLLRQPKELRRSSRKNMATNGLILKRELSSKMRVAMMNELSKN